MHVLGAPLIDVQSKKVTAHKGDDSGAEDEEEARYHGPKGKGPKGEGPKVLKTKRSRPIHAAHGALGDLARAGFGVGSFGRFVETGTFLGQTVVALSAHFSELHSIELSRECFEAAKLFAWKAQRPIHFHQGHSTKVLQAILPKLNGPTVFYLDAHFSGSVTAGLEEKVPLPEELLLISELFPHAALVIIDDLDLFAQVNTFEAIDGRTGAFSGRHPSDWRSITCEALERSSSFRCFGSFKAKNRFILQLRADGKGGIDSGQDRSSQFNAAFSSVGL
ncbi:unnamed protein product [Durusdinium trenchii]|uniref:Uncharacterized protein n=1 Tax=Durusdinium trenchii TaxID=1381693 RepID=A0ABP0P0Y2_9DINO